MRATTEIPSGFDEALIGVGSSLPCPVCSQKRDTVQVNRIDFDVVNRARFSHSLEGFVRCGESHVVHFLAAHPTVVARSTPRYQRLLNAADLIISDGTPIALMIRAKRRQARRLTSTDGFRQACAEGVARNTRHFFVGGADEQVAGALRRELDRSFPGITIAGFDVPPFRPYTDEEFAALVSRIRSSGAQIVWIGIGAPKQEVLAHKLRAAGAAPVVATIGATFDFIAGRKPRAPMLFRALGMEWSFRLILEPKRLWRRYLLGNLQFLSGVIADMIRR